MGTIRTRNRRGKDTLGCSISTLVIVILLNVCQLSRANPVFVDNPSLAHFQSGRNIRHLPCIVRKSGLSGVCMFAIDCIKQNGTHLGTCIDRFYFGSCCQMKDDTKVFAEEISDNSIDQNTISHFSHETSTLSTNSVFKMPTESYIDTLGIRNHSTTHPYVPVSTITHMASKIESTTMRYITSRRPTIPSTTPSTTTTTTTTTTTPAPTTTRRPSDPPRRRTTTAVPILTIAPETGFEDIFDSTTMPSKFTTFQMVETSTPNRPTEPTIFEDIQYTTTLRHPINTRRPTTPPPRTKKPLITRIPAANFTTTTTASTTTRPTSRTTPKYKPSPTKRITTTKKPLPTKRPVTTTTTIKIRPTRRPVLHNEAINTTTSSPTRNDPTVTESNVKETTISEPTTRAPRPKPKPTAEIFKIPRPTVATETTTLRLEPKTPTTTRRPTTTTPEPTTTPVPTTTTTEKTTTTRRTTHRPPTTSTTTTTTTTTPAPTTTTTTPIPTTTPTTTTTTKKPTTTTTTTAKRPTTTTTTTTTPRPTTQRITTTEQPPEPTSTYRPTLVTWTTVIDNKPNNTHVTIEETDWQPKPPPADWVPVPTIDPEVAANKNATAIVTASSPLSPTTEGVDLPSSTAPNKIELSWTTTSAPLDLSTDRITPSTTTTTEVPTTTTTERTTTTTRRTTHRPSTTTVATTTTPIPTTTTTPSSTTTTESSGESFTETSTPETSTDWSTEEDFNVTTTIPFTTVSSIPSLEGVDYKQVCGRRMFPEPRIVGGSNAAFGRWPWQISLRQWRTSTYLHKCGAALLNENWAITAAHCVDNVPPSDLLLRLGEYDLAEEEEPYGYQERRVQIVASHPQFDPRTFEYDLALLRFYEPVVFQPNIIPVCVPGSDEDFIGQTAFVTGWGRLYEDGPLPSVLQEVAVPIINNTICETMYRAAGYIEHIPHIFICAGWKKGGYDSCEGDSGGPMVLQREMDKRFILGGVISWGIGCAEPNQPGVYTRISEFRDWINQILQF